MGEVRFYHLDLSGSGVPESGLALLLADRAGEEYRSAADDLSTAAGFVEMARADCITVLVDGERLVDLGLRHNARSETVMILQALIEGGAIQPGQRLALVLTKLDVVLKSEDRDRVESDFASLRMRIQTLFSNVFSVISAFQVADSPRSDSVARGTGVADLLAFWIAPKQRPPAEARSRRIPDRAFARLSVAEE
ncbi:MAG: hypothetical protein E6R14_00675 [Thermomicrobiales bacterium]|nr:MAG: hypothetical protein E6R14_00675 [Thermomicrobiales bacterium]